VLRKAVFLFEHSQPSGQFLEEGNTPMMAFFAAYCHGNMAPGEYWVIVPAINQRAGLLSARSIINGQ